MKRIYIIAAASLMLASCGGNKWKVKGSIYGAEEKTVTLEAADNGRWYALDSTKADNNGSFSMSREAAGYPDIYRLRVGDRTIYFPIDSTETVTVTAGMSNPEEGYSLDGSTSAVMLADVERRLNALVRQKGVDAAVNDSLFKRELGGMVIGDPAGIVTYYIISKRIDGRPLFNPDNRADLRIIGAVANAFDRYRPDDPRTGYLKSLYLNNRKRTTTAPTDTIYASEARLFDINLLDETGKARSLAEVAGQGKVTVLNFTVYDVNASPAYNRELAKVYESRKSAGLEIYQVSVDPDEFKWRQSAKNLPWITVYNSPVDGSEALLHYNVTDLPATFIIDRQGDIVERVSDVTQLGDTVDKYL
ncbi:MAG: redoxin domain-containing protein [Pseudoflavonifractor sp.]|nr:redoxin domain-containing protein [Pseudoflavonifractor sp.]